ncbi:SusD/RagB family nutrient-binding outer membrane lipoprotein [Porifericola rhodea]|uniref:SusD/RagB family nutrient-binding outer membrane lipoprotein n=1 Tax=Porifericola rhodea TaxID=930972 RepID=UPI00266652D3|nr:SusD/RagB family nutrient-binding outer membrane lipoprotein [Porifericola rhodea]WKN31446.1 SusD/RagB family nutrient-binding outer membrane lipoprotein [Porifericola rhodea]
MKITYKYLIVLLIFFSACDNGFDELNTNETDATNIDPIFQLNDAIINTSFPGSVLVYDMGIVQQIITPNSGVITGANFNQDNRNSTEAMWVNYYREVILNTRDIIRRVEGEPERNNLYQMTRILQAYAFMLLTDSYGDVPYFEAGKAFSDQVFLPTYDTQQEIYPEIIDELSAATAALDANGKVEGADILYGGDVEKWKKFGSALLLRAGMRLSKVDPSRAAEVVQAAVQSGVITDNDDNAYIRHDANYVNGVGRTLNATEANNYYLAAPFVDYLKNNNDPRLRSIAVTYVGAASGPEQVPGPDGNGSNDPEIQIGMPMGNNDETAKQVAAELGLASFYEFAQADRSRVVKQTAPMFLVTASQSQLLMAEAAERGWISGDAASYFEQGIRAHMEQMATYDEDSAIPGEEIDTYVAANPLQGANALEQINTQYWVSSFLNGPEAFANFRRSGYPELDPNPFPNQDISGDFIRRLTYPSSELAVNTAKIQEAISRQGADNLETRVWWDVD